MSMSTPTKSKPAPDPKVTDSPGTWRHPRLDEITRRRNATTFSEKNVRHIGYSFGACFSIWMVQIILQLKVFKNILPTNLRWGLDWMWMLMQFLPIANVAWNVMPLFRQEDDLSDIALTSEQRKLLGLPPSSAAPTPDAKYSTPPRYSRTPSGSIGSGRSYASSPLSGKGSPLPQGDYASSYSPLGSPLFKKGLDASVNGRRSSFGSPGPFAGGTSSALFSDLGSPSPSGSKRTSVGLNSKWLYEKGRRSSGSAWQH